MWKRRVERSSLENVQRRGKLNLFGRLSGMDSSKSSRSRLMRFSAITPAKSNEFFFSLLLLVGIARGKVFLSHLISYTFSIHFTVHVCYNSFEIFMYINIIIIMY